MCHDWLDDSGHSLLIPYALTDRFSYSVFRSPAFNSVDLGYFGCVQNVVLEVTSTATQV